MIDKPTEKIPNLEERLSSITSAFDVVSEKVPELEKEMPYSTSIAINPEKHPVDSLKIDNLMLTLSAANHTDLEKELQDWSNSQLHSVLFKIDPPRASRLHPNDRRKVVRSLQIWSQTGSKHSDLIAKQSSNHTNVENEVDKPGKSLGGPLRFENCLCFWIQVSKEILQERIDNRGDKMLELGLREEIDSYNDILKAENADR